jgi:hypothetical protein
VPVFNVVENRCDSTEKPAMILKGLSLHLEVVLIFVAQNFRTYLSIEPFLNEKMHIPKNLIEWMN